MTTSTINRIVTFNGKKLVEFVVKTYDIRNNLVGSKSIFKLEQ